MKKTNYHPSLFVHWTKIPVRFRDIDALNHVNNAVFNTYFEEARIRFVYNIPEFRQTIGSENSFVLVRIEIDYITPVYLNETLLIGSSVEAYGNTSIKGIQAIYCENSKELKSIAKSTGVWYNLSEKKPLRLPDIQNREQYLFKQNI